ncbi:DivIVA domain-containing protein [Micromonospora sp. SH-82]|uniref:DivIVA domain-containing protein n=1 Tax=Micromonospora sp. SH-82 TaxID=3132938 RepID=UPI003EC087A6
MTTEGDPGRTPAGTGVLDDEAIDVLVDAITDVEVDARLRQALHTAGYADPVDPPPQVAYRIGAHARPDAGETTGPDDATVAELTAELERLRREKAAAERALGLIHGKRDQPDPPTDSEQQALQMLMLVRRTADENLAEARREADRLVTTARQQAEELVEEARTRAETLDREAQQRHRDAEEQYQTTMTQLVTDRDTVQAQVDKLRGFEREYRIRLEAYLEGQLRHLRQDAEPNRDPAPAEQFAAPGSAGPESPAPYPVGW